MLVKWQHNAYDNVTDTIGSGFDYLNDKTGLENKDYTMMALNQGANLLQPTPEQPIQHAPVGQGISKPNMDLTQTDGLLSSVPPATDNRLPKSRAKLHDWQVNLLLSKL